MGGQGDNGTLGMFIGFDTIDRKWAICYKQCKPIRFVMTCICFTIERRWRSDTVGFVQCACGCVSVCWASRTTSSHHMASLAASIFPSIASTSTSAARDSFTFAALLWKKRRDYMATLWTAWPSDPTLIFHPSSCPASRLELADQIKACCSFFWPSLVSSFRPPDRSWYI